MVDLDQVGTRPSSLKAGGRGGGERRERFCDRISVSLSHLIKPPWFELEPREVCELPLGLLL